MSTILSNGRALDDIDVRIEQLEGGHAEGSRMEVATFAEGEYVESILISRGRAAEIYRELGRLLARELGPDHESDVEREIPVCPRCGSDSVAADAAARWSTQGQLWEVTNIFDKGHGCDDCGAQDFSFDWITEREHAERESAKAARITLSP